MESADNGTIVAAVCRTELQYALFSIWQNDRYYRVSTRSIILWIYYICMECLDLLLIRGSCPVQFMAFYATTESHAASNPGRQSGISSRTGRDVSRVFSSCPRTQVDNGSPMHTAQSTLFTRLRLSLCLLEHYKCLDIVVSVLLRQTVYSCLYVCMYVCMYV